MNTERLHFCRGCDRQTRQVFLYSENGAKPSIKHWRCTVRGCGMEFLAYANLPDAEGLCLVVRAAFTRDNAVTDYGDIRSLDPEDVLAELRVLLLELYAQEWRPEKTPSFRAYATWTLPQRYRDYLRQDRGRGGAKAHVRALSLDGPGRYFQEEDGDDRDGGARVPGRALGESLGASAGDHAEGGLADFERAIARRGRDVAREERALGLRTAERA